MRVSDVLNNLSTALSILMEAVEARQIYLDHMYNCSEANCKECQRLWQVEMDAQRAAIQCIRGGEGAPDIDKLYTSVTALIDAVEKVISGADRNERV